ncbi:MAG: GGDEF domain-containing protein [Lachnospiraceae bacterium]|nr:GGDEF domain-containing protein [Lachnospiraceae bacterium]
MINNIEQNLWNSLLKSTNIKFFWKDCERRFLGASQSFLDYYCFDDIRAILGKTDEEIGWHINPDPYQNDELRVIQNGETIHESPGTCIIRGQVRNILATKMPLKDDREQIIGLIGYFVDVTDEYRRNELLVTRANTDQLTGLLNRHGFRAAVDEYVRAYETRNVDFGILFLDIDGFKSVNETYGHTFGDTYLVDTTKLLLKIASNSCSIARFGGDSFVLMKQLPTVDTPGLLNNSMLNLIDRIRMQLSEIRNIEGHSFRTGISIGFATYSEYEDVEKTIASADARMYADKNSKKS